MSTKRHVIVIQGLHVEIVRKDIKNLHLGVYPPHGRVRVAAPLKVSDNAVRLAVIGKLGWIKRQRAAFEAQPRQSKREMVGGESHYFLGRRYRLRVVESDGPVKVSLRNKAVIELRVSKASGAEHRERALQAWYRQELKKLVPPLLEKWQPILEVEAAEWGIKKMKTKWGSCNTKARRIWLNLELAKKSLHCLQYIIVHELAHLSEPHHNDRFIVLMDKHLPEWRHYRRELNSAPLAHESWQY